MNCDTAFDLMTDPQGFRSGALASHLYDCPRCRQMQATLAPALDFLAEARDEGFSAVSAAPFIESLAESGTQVGSEALQVAERTAQQLSSRVQRPAFLWKQATARGLRYAAVFAAGLALAFAFWPQQRGAGRLDGRCRRDALQTISDRSPEQLQALLLSCAACHGRKQTHQPDTRSGWLSNRPGASSDWLVLILADERLVAGPTPLTRASAGVSRTPLPGERAPEDGLDRQIGRFDVYSISSVYDSAPIA